MKTFKFFPHRFSGISNIPSFYGAIYAAFANQQANSTKVLKSHLEESYG
jgi:hypothetical protein